MLQIRLIESAMDIRKIESRDNPQLKLARKVRDGNEREFIFVEGRRLAEEAVRSDVFVQSCFIEEDYERGSRQAELLASVSKITNEIFEVNERLLKSISDTDSTQGIVLICRRPNTDRQKFEREVLARNGALPLVVMLSEINNPSNLGAVIRTAEAAGVAGVIIGPNSADVHSAKALRGAMGSTFRMPIWSGASKDDVLAWASEQDFSTVGTSAEAKETYSDIDWTGQRLLIMGSEAHGLDPDFAGKLDQIVRIPMNGDVESLNLAVATGVILFEAKRQSGEL